MDDMKFNLKNVVLAHQVLDGIPEEVIELHTWCSRMGTSLSCGTVACGGGWLAMSPQFKKQGLYINKVTGLPALHGLSEDDDVGTRTVFRKLFGTERASHYLFASRNFSPWDARLIAAAHPYKLSDKELLLGRLKRAYYGSI